MMQILAWRILAMTALLLALVGVVVPGLPTVPFLLVAAWGGARAWPSLERRLLEHPAAGPPIRRWRENRAVPRTAKWAATAMMALSLALAVVGGTEWLVTGLLAALLLTVAGWIWSRPDA